MGQRAHTGKEDLVCLLRKVVLNNRAKFQFCNNFFPYMPFLCLIFLDWGAPSCCFQLLLFSGLKKKKQTEYLYWTRVFDVVIFREMSHQHGTFTCTEQCQWIIMILRFLKKLAHLTFDIYVNRIRKRKSLA